MRKLRLWAPESDFDAKALQVIAREIAIQAGAALDIRLASQAAYNTAARSDRLRTAVEAYLKEDDVIIFLIDYDNPESDAARKGQKNYYSNRIKPLVQAFPERVLLCTMKCELEAWLLVDVLGICCYFAESQDNRTDEKWTAFAKKHQSGNTETFQEANPGGSGVKEVLVELSKEILKKLNPKRKDKSFSKHTYTESMAPKLAGYLVMDKQTLQRNASLQTFASHLTGTE